MIKANRFLNNIHSSRKSQWKSFQKFEITDQH
jgi:hypothetical protein